MQENSKCSLYGNKEEMINHIINKCSKLSQKDHKTRYNWVGKASCWQLCKRLKLDHTNKWYIHKPESILENEINKILRDSEIQTDHLIPARKPNLVLITKKITYCIIHFAIPADHILKIKESEKRDSI